jgi:hypothetical protein
VSRSGPPCVLALPHRGSGPEPPALRCKAAIATPVCRGCPGAAVEPRLAVGIVQAR